MEVAKLIIVFSVMIIVLIVLKRSLWLASLLSCFTAILLYTISPGEVWNISLQSITSSTTIELVAVIYLVSLLQAFMERCGAAKAAESAMLQLFNNPRTTMIISPIFIGLLPAPNAVLLSAPMVDSAAGDTLDLKEKTFITSYYRHIPESIFPIYTGILLALKVTGLSAAKFVLYMLPMALLSILFPYFTTVRKVPKETGFSVSNGSRKKAALELIKALWPVMLLIAVVVLFDFSTGLSAFVILTALVFIYRFSFSDLKLMLKKAFSANIIFSMILIMIFTGLMSSTGAITRLAEILIALPIPSFLIYAIINFIGGYTGLGMAIIAVIFPIAFATVPGAGIPLLVLLICFSHAAIQLTPIHICLDIIVKYFKIEFKDLILKTIPVTLIYCVSAVLYYLLLV